MTNTGELAGPRNLSTVVIFGRAATQTHLIDALKLLRQERERPPSAIQRQAIAEWERKVTLPVDQGNAP